MVYDGAMATTLTDEQLAFIRSRIGDAEPPDDDDLQEIFDRLTSPTPAGVAYEVLSWRLANFLSDPASYTIEGVYQESAQSNITGLQAQLRLIAAERDEELGVTGSSVIRVARLVRGGRVR